MRGKQAPSLVSHHQGIPGTGPQRIDVNTRAGPGWTHYEPPIRRSTPVSGVFEQIVPEVLWHRVILQELPASMVFPKATVEDVQGTVIAGGAHVVNVVLHLHFDTVALIVFATFEALVPVLLGQTLHRPLLQCLPSLLQPCDHHRLVRSLKIPDKFLAVHFSAPNALCIVRKVAEWLKILRIPQLTPCTLIIELCCPRKCPKHPKIPIT